MRPPHAADREKKIWVAASFHTQSKSEREKETQTDRWRKKKNKTESRGVSIKQKTFDYSE